MSLPVAILAGGLASRLRPATETVPKVLLDVAGEPFAVHQIKLLREQGYSDVVFLVGYLGNMIRDALGDGSRWGVRLRYVFDDSPAGDRNAVGQRALRGTGGAINHALPYLGDAFLVLYGDSYLDCDYAAVEQAFAASGRAGLMTVFRNDDRWDASNVQFEGGRIVRYDKTHKMRTMCHIDYGLGILTRSAFRPFDDEAAFDLTAVYQRLIANDDLAGFEVPGRFYEIGSPNGLAETRAHLARKRISTS